MINRKDIENLRLVKCKKSFNSSSKKISYLSDKFESILRATIPIKKDIDIKNKILDFIEDNCNIKDVSFEKDKLYKVDKLEYYDMSLTEVYIYNIRFHTSFSINTYLYGIDEYFETITLAELREIRINAILNENR